MIRLNLRIKNKSVVKLNLCDDKFKYKCENEFKYK